jgi:hypothetical protein
VLPRYNLGRADCFYDFDGLLASSADSSGGGGGGGFAWLVKGWGVGGLRDQGIQGARGGGSNVGSSVENGGLFGCAE